MNFAQRLLCILALALPLIAQTPSTATTSTAPKAVTAPVTTSSAPPAPSASDDDDTTSTEVRSRLSSLIRQHPPEVGTIFALEPSLLSNEAFLAGYPDIAAFVAQHPEVRQHPGFYVSEFEQPRPRYNTMTHEILDMLGVAFVMLLITIAASWLIRTLIEQRRWTRLSRTQAEVHNKILDRFGSTDELLTYIKTPAGSKFLESAPIPLHSEPAKQNIPMARTIWSLQIGVIIASAAIGMMLVSSGLDRETAAGLFAMGVVGLCVGGGFIVSAFVSLFLSRRLGVWQPSPADALRDGELVK